ncbi:alkaline phosphatase family protein [Nocardioides korecus]
MISRRTLLGVSAATAGLAAASGSLPDASATTSVTPTDLTKVAPGTSGIDHVVVVMMENRSFDHFLGWLPGARGRQSGLTFTDRYGVRHGTHHLKTFASCGNTDPDHSYEGGRIELGAGHADGWLKTGENDLLSIGYYGQSDLGFFGKAAPYWTTCDQYFSAIMAETYPNRFYQHSAQTDRIHNSSTTSTLPTIWDRCAAAGVSHTYYYSDVPFLALWGSKYLSISSPYEKFLADAATGTLPQVSFLDPRFGGEGDGISGDDHPSADIRVGEKFLADVYTAITNGPGWANTLLVVNYDEWGGFFDHVAPGTAPDVTASNGLRGFRVPALVVSPRARRKFVAPWTYDHTSVLKMIEWRFGLAPLTTRDAHARNLAEVLDFSSPPSLTAPAISVPAVVPTPCEAPAPVPRSLAPESEWGPLKDRAIKDGWKIL